MGKDRVQELLTELASELPPEAFAAVTARGQAGELEEAAAEILEAQRDADETP